MTASISSNGIIIQRWGTYNKKWYQTFPVNTGPGSTFRFFFRSEGANLDGTKAEPWRIECRIFVPIYIHSKGVYDGPEV